MGVFYERFVGASDVVRERFSSTTIENQKKILQDSLQLVSRAYQGFDDGLTHLESIARTHSRRHLDIPPSLYELWLKTLIATAQDFDPEFSERIESAWRAVLRPGIERMIDVYRTENTVRPTR
jgi:hemoglobin-like flavoprotein